MTINFAEASAEEIISEYNLNLDGLTQVVETIAGIIVNGLVSRSHSANDHAQSLENAIGHINDMKALLPEDSVAGGEPFLNGLLFARDLAKSLPPAATLVDLAGAIGSVALVFVRRDAEAGVEGAAEALALAEALGLT